MLIRIGKYVLIGMSMNTNMIMAWRHERIGITRAWAKHGRLMGQDEARKRLRARMHKVSDSVITS
ncbi:hypothetical protein Hanom_Chr06g00513781 [Helianthus anomalus]